MDLVEVMGKQNRKVPVLLTKNLRLGINLLIETRNKCGVDGLNKYVFAKVNKIGFLAIIIIVVNLNTLKQRY